MYKFTEIELYGKRSKVIIRENGDGTTTSFGEYEANTDYQAYLRWCDEGNTPLPAENA